MMEIDADRNTFILSQIGLMVLMVLFDNTCFMHVHFFLSNYVSYVYLFIGYINETDSSILVIISM